MTLVHVYTGLSTLPKTKSRTYLIYLQKSVDPIHSYLSLLSGIKIVMGPLII